MSNRHRGQNLLKNVIWVCDKPSCKYTNSRTIKNTDVVNDDICDKCGKHVHEPLTKTIIK